MNWGVKIAILYSAFVALILFLVFKTTTQNIELVADDYYEQELKYEQKIVALKNTNELGNKILINCNDSEIVIKYPTEFAQNNVTGSLLFFRPAGASEDRGISINPSKNGTQVVSTIGFKRGLYKLQLEWKMNNKDYLFEENVFIN